MDSRIPQVRISALLLVLGELVLGGQLARAEGEVKKPVAGEALPALAGPEEEIDIKEVVISSMKTKTTTQEAPAIISVRTAQEIKDIGFRYIDEVAGSFPAFLKGSWQQNFFPISFFARGYNITPVFMVDGIDLRGGVMGFIDGTYPGFPLHTIKRMEVTSGPASVLWGGGALLGAFNIQTKTADDLDGIEARLGYGDGPGGPGWVKAYVMAGQKLFKNRLKIFAHVSFDTFRAPEYEVAIQPLLQTVPPWVTSNATFIDQPMTSVSARSWYGLFSGNAQAGPFSLYWSVPLVTKFRPSMMWQGGILRAELGEDRLDCNDPQNAARCASRVDPTQRARYNEVRSGDYYGSLGYRQRFWENKLGVAAKAFYAYFLRDNPIMPGMPATDITTGGILLSQDLSSWRTGVNVEGDILLPWDLSLIVGGEVSYEGDVPGPATLQGREDVITRFPQYCYFTDSPTLCTVPFIMNAYRVQAGAFVDLKKPIFPGLVVNAGARIQGFTGTIDSYPPAALFSGAMVWNFLPNWHAKALFTEGFLPPVFQQTANEYKGYGYAAELGIRVQRSRAVQGEINSRLLRGHGPLAGISLRGDYSYTWLTDLIEYQNGLARNTTTAGIHTAELLVRLELKKGHWMDLGYTFMDVNDADKGKIRSLPSQWLTLLTAANLWRRQLLLTSSLLVLSSSEDPNYFGTATQTGRNVGDRDAEGNPVPVSTVAAKATDITIDRIAPSAIWNMGLRFLLPKQHLRFSVDVYNLLNTATYYPNPYLELTAENEKSPVPRERISFMAAAELTY